MTSNRPTRPDREILSAFVDLAGPDLWLRRLAEIRRQAQVGPRAGKAILNRQIAAYTVERLRKGLPVASEADLRVVALVAEVVAVARALSTDGCARLREQLRTALTGASTLAPLLHVFHTAALQRARGFAVRFPGLEEAAPFDLLIARDGVEAEIVCEPVSAEEGRSLHRGAWFNLADRIDPDLQTWLAAHPGRYVLRVSLPEGLREGDGLARLHERIRHMLACNQRTHHGPAAVLRLDRLMLAGAQANELGVLSSLKREFGPEANLAVTTAGGGLFAMAAQAGRENEVALAICRHMAKVASARLSGRRPGILAMFVDDIGRQEWVGLRDRLELEGEARQFLTTPQARPVVAVTFVSRHELFGPAKGTAEGDLRFRNPAHPSARAAALAPAIASSV
ncbi:MAG: hypothetical protein JO118_03300 [Acetobacteraceae bacterium]|nr:hypothetical protein [Acetobacteraceae bacterium]MBV9776166.1 hypothetical protein [Acetobacteraceae bacterium]